MTTYPDPVPATVPDVVAERWPDVARVPNRPLRAAVTRRLMTSVVANLPLRVVMPDGAVLGAGDASSPVMRMNRPADFFQRVGDGGLIGVGEAYQAGDWDAGVDAEGHPADLLPLLCVFAERMGTLIPKPLQKLRRLAVRSVPHATRNTLEGSRSNIAHHYDLSNDLFTLFLDPSLTYSSALFDRAADRERPAEFADLAAAQERKIDRLLDRANVGPGSSVLEIGTGWGQLALQAAARGATVRSITLSEEQAALARQRVAEAGYAEQVSIELCDYRSVTGKYDAVVSVEMVEAVGEAYWDTYLRVLDSSLKPGGVAAIQAITMPHDRMLASRRTYTWIHKYVFPGGIIPSVDALADSASRTSLRIVDDLAFGLDYAETLRLWRERFEANATAVAALGFDDVFRRMWTFYLAYSEAGFRARYLDVHQLTFAREA